MSRSVWSVVLAAGYGRRLLTVTCGIPKQFWRYPGGQSLLDDTLGRIGPFAPRERTAIVIDRTHRQLVSSSTRGSADWIIEQPMDRGTAAGVLLALTPVLDAGEDAIVLLTPSDHAVGNRELFRSCVQDAVVDVEARRADIVLIGAEATKAITDYGWITRAPSEPDSSGRLPGVRSFMEKPPEHIARGLLRSGALWNTMVLVGCVSRLARLYEEHLAETAVAFRRYRQLTPAERGRSLRDIYDGLTAADFSRDILQPAEGLAVCALPRGTGWSDLGTPARLDEWLAQMAQAEAV